jgi:hypothetical protein
MRGCPTRETDLVDFVEDVPSRVMNTFFGFRSRWNVTRVSGRQAGGDLRALVDRFPHRQRSVGE